MPRLFDSHAHLSDERLSSDIAAVLQRAAACGVQRVLLPASDMADSQAVVHLAAQYPDSLCCSVGVHPHDAKEVQEADYARLAELAQAHPQLVVAIGEIGLDYHYDFSPRPVQQAVFRRQLELAHALKLPVILHAREAFGDFMSILREAAEQKLLAAKPGVVHCYSGSVETAQELLKMGFYLGFDGPITYKNARQSHEVLAVCPLERILIETDSPYLSPQPYRGKTNEPAYVVEICRKIAELKACSYEAVAEQTYINACTLFGLND